MEVGYKSSLSFSGERKKQNQSPNVQGQEVKTIKLLTKSPRIFPGSIGEDPLMTQLMSRQHNGQYPCGGFQICSQIFLDSFRPEMGANSSLLK